MCALFLLDMCLVLFFQADSMMVWQQWVKGEYALVVCEGQVGSRI